MPQEALGRENDQRFAEFAVQLPADQVLVVARCAGRRVFETQGERLAVDRTMVLPGNLAVAFSAGIGEPEPVDGGFGALSVLEVMGPVAILRSKKKTKKDIEIAARIAARYSDVPAGKAMKLKCAGKALSVKPYKDEDFAAWRVQAQETKSAEPVAEPKPATETARKHRGKARH